MATPTAHRRPRTLNTALLRLLIRAQLARLTQRQEGVTTIEYVLVVAVLALVVFAALKGFFGAVASKFSELTKTISSG